MFRDYLVLLPAFHIGHTFLLFFRQYLNIPLRGIPNNTIRYETITHSDGRCSGKQRSYGTSRY